MSYLTYDNFYYRSQTSNEKDANHSHLQLIAQTGELPLHVRKLLAQSISANSRKAYGADLRKFLGWGGSIPSDSRSIAIFLAEHATTHSVSTIRRWVASLSRAHQAAGMADPTKCEPARSTLRGITRSQHRALHVASPLSRDDLLKILANTDDTVRDKRDCALLLIGFAGGFRRSELIALNVDDIDFARRGLVISIRQSKTDQCGIGRTIAIPFGRTTTCCPVTALEKWFSVSKVEHGALFRSVKKGNRISDSRLSAEAVSKIVKARVASIDLDPARYSGHSLRAGLATSAAEAGVPSWKIRQQTGHSSDAMLARYIRSTELFDGNAAGVVL